MIFHRFIPSIVFLFIFCFLIVFGMFKLVFWHYPRFYWLKDKQSRKFVYHFPKALDHAACAAAFGGLSDQTISDKAGRVFKEQKWESPWWVLLTKKLTEDYFKDSNHLERSIEPLRPDPTEE